MRFLVGNAGGVRGLYAGLGPVLAGAVPARASYILALEGVRPPAEAAARSLGADGASAAAIGHGSAGFSAAAVSMLIYVPVDVISQKMMVPDTAGGSAAIPTFAQTVRSTVQTGGYQGLYRGLGISMLIGLPAGSIWWGTYGSARAALGASTSLGSASKDGILQKVIAATMAATATVLSVTPLDTIKTRVQLATGDAEPALGLAMRLVRRDGFFSLYAGTTPRLLHLSLWSSMLIVVYEELKRTCVKR